MTDRQKGSIFFSCDGCCEVLDTDTKEFDEALERLRSEEWKSRRNGKEWSHYCPGCKRVNCKRA